MFLFSTKLLIITLCEDNRPFSYVESNDTLYFNRPVKIHLDIDTNMKMVGKRFPYYASYKVNYHPLSYSVIELVIQAGFSDDGTVNGIAMDIYTDSGCLNNEQSSDFALLYIDNGKSY